MSFYKAVREDGTDFFTGRVDYLAGGVVAHPHPGKVGDSDAFGHLSVSTEAADCTGFSWPCRLLLVEPVGDVWAPSHSLPSKRACHGLRVVGEVEAWRAFGPNGRDVVAFLGLLPTLTASQLDAVRAAAWDAVRDAARVAAWRAARVAAWDAAWGAVRGAVRGAAWVAARALVVRDLITADQFDILTAPMRAAGIDFDRLVEA